MPAILEISTMVGCAMRCDYCPQTLHVKRYAKYNDSSDYFRMTLADFKKCLSTVPKEVEIMFAGMAEPWLNWHATDMVLYAHDEGHRVAVYTTTVGLSPNDVKRIKDIPFLHFCIHLPDAEGRMKLKIDHNYLLGLEAATEIPNHHFTIVGTLSPIIREIVGRDVVDDSPGLISRAGNLPDHVIGRNRGGAATLVPPPLMKTGKIRCSATEPGTLNHNVLLPNGDVVICCCDYNIEHIFGNLLVSDYASLFTSQEYQRVMKGLNENESMNITCRRCELSIPT